MGEGSCLDRRPAGGDLAGRTGRGHRNRWPLRRGRESAQMATMKNGAGSSFTGLMMGVVGVATHGRVSDAVGIGGFLFGVGETFKGEKPGYSVRGRVRQRELCSRSPQC